MITPGRLLADRRGHMNAGQQMPFISMAVIFSILAGLAALCLLVAGLIVALSSRYRKFEKAERARPPGDLFWGIFPVVVTAAYFTAPEWLHTSFVFAIVVAGYALAAGRNGKSFAPGGAAALALRHELRCALATVLLLGGAFAAGSFALQPAPKSPYAEAVMPAAPRLPDCLPDDSIQGDFSGLWSTSFGHLELSRAVDGSYTGKLDGSPVKGKQAANILSLEGLPGKRSIADVALCRDGKRFDGQGPFGGYR